MSLWRAALTAAALLSMGSAQPAHHAAAHLTVAHTARAIVAASPPSPSPPMLATPSTATLSQVGTDTWQATVAITAVSGNCPTSPASYALATTSPNLVLRPHRQAQLVHGDNLRATPRSCEVTLTFISPRLSQVPATATLTVSGISSLALTVSRSVSLFDYLAIPAIAGASMAALLLGFCLIAVKVYDRDGNLQGPFRCRAWRLANPGFWTHPVYASGAWTLNDSWATNIVGAIAVLGTVLALIPATDLLFRGVSLDRFLILNATAAGIAGAAPLVFAIRYARYVRRFPGVTSDARLTLPDESKPYPDTALTDLTLTLTLAPGTLVSLPAGTLLPATDHQANAPASAPATKPTRAQLNGAVTALLEAPAQAVSTGTSTIFLLPARVAPSVMLVEAATVTLPDGQPAALSAALRAVSLPAGAAAALRAEDWVRLFGSNPDSNGGRGVTVSCPAGALITAPWGATAISRVAGSLGAAQIDSGSKLDIPLDTQVCIMAKRIALPSGPDVLVQGACAIDIGSQSDPSALLTIAASNVTGPKDHPSDDVCLPLPVRIVAPAGAKLTVNGVAAATMPAGTTVNAAYRKKDQQLTARRLNFRLPQDSSSLTGTVGMVLLAALVTMVGAGAQLGVATLLATRFAGLNTVGLAAAWVTAVLVAGFALYYSVTAIMSLVDPQPGSSMSSTAGTSFTL